jgi:hypothetical protein
VLLSFLQQAHAKHAILSCYMIVCACTHTLQVEKGLCGDAVLYYDRIRPRDADN